MKMKKILTFVLAICLVCGLPLTPAYAAQKQYPSNWLYWSQGQTGIGGKVQSSGCRILAQAKVLAETGIGGNSFDPDVFAIWGWNNGYFGKKNEGLALADKVTEQTAGNAPAAYAKAMGKTLYNCGSVQFPSKDKAEQNEFIMQWLRDGYYVILCRNTKAHYEYVPRSYSLQKGTTYLSRSGHNLVKGEVKEYVKAFGGETFTYAWLYSTKTKSAPITVNITTTTVEKLTETSVEPHGTVSSTGAKVTEVGMYLGSSEDNLTKLGQDNGKPGYHKNMYYSTTKYGRTLSPGTTYYYQAYAIVDGKEYRGTVESFTTLGSKQPEVMITPSIALSKTSVSMNDNVCTSLSATTIPSGQKVTWKSSNTAVVTVSSSGMLEGIKAGAATVTASMTYEGKTYSASCHVTVNESAPQEPTPTPTPTPAPTPMPTPTPVPKDTCTTHKYTSSGGDICTVCGYKYVSPKKEVNKTMYAAEEEVVVRTSPYEYSSKIVKTLKKDDAVKINYSITNSLGNQWYITSDGYYIYSKRLTFTAPKVTCATHKYTSSSGDICTVCGEKYNPPLTVFNKTMYAVEKEVVVRTAPYEYSSTIVKTLKKGDAVEIAYSTTNSLGNKWYITSDGYYIYSKRLSTSKP